MALRALSSTIAGVLVNLRPLGDNCWGARIGKAAFLCHETIDSQAKATNWLLAAKELLGPERPATMRLSVEQLGLPESDWDLITAEHILLAWLVSEEGLSLQVAHLNIPVQPLYTPKDQLAPSEFLMRTVDKLPKLQNIDAWETYCYWLHEEMERVLETFHLESMEIYTLQALLLDFVHEVRATLLLSEEAEVKETLLKLGGVRQLLDKKSEVESIALEKILVRTRGDVREKLTVQHETLSKMVPVIAAIEQGHRELIPLKWQASILEHLLGPQLDIPKLEPHGWIQKLILLQLFHEELEIATCVSSDERSFVAFAVHIAAAILRQKNSFQLLLDMGMHWKDLVGNIDKAFLKHGESYGEHLNDLERLTEHFRQIVVEVLERLCIPMTDMGTTMTGKPREPHWHETQRVNGDILDLLPIMGTLAKEGRQQRVAFSKPAFSGQAKTIYPAAHQLFVNLSRSN
ncbi:MAG: hypothetical protein LLG04_16080 [Parachlamydia sp.]|nr:hypothetical protein [Parachlamydia sp.]